MVKTVDWCSAQHGPTRSPRSFWNHERGMCPMIYHCNPQKRRINSHLYAYFRGKLFFLSFFFWGLQWNLQKRIDFPHQTHQTKCQNAQLSSSCWHTQKQSRAFSFGDSGVSCVMLRAWSSGLFYLSVHYLKMASKYTEPCPCLRRCLLLELQKTLKAFESNIDSTFCVHGRQAFLNSMREVKPHVWQARCHNSSMPRRTVGMGPHFPPQPRRFHCYARVGAAEQALPDGHCSEIVIG